MKVSKCLDCRCVAYAEQFPEWLSKAESGQHCLPTVESCLHSMVDIECSVSKALAAEVTDLERANRPNAAIWLPRPGQAESWTYKTADSVALDQRYTPKFGL